MMTLYAIDHIEKVRPELDIFTKRDAIFSEYKLWESA